MPVSRRKRSRWLGGFALLGLVVAGAVYLAGPWLRPFRVSDFWPLDLARPGGWLVDRQLAELARDPALCSSVLKAPQIEAKPIADKAVVAGCGWENAVAIRSVGSARLDAGEVSCGLAAALALWVEHVVQPTALAELGVRVTAIEHVGAYACRNIRGSAAFTGWRSQHARANALDVKGFRLADGRRLSVKDNWGGGGPEGRFLGQIHQAACPYFRVAIGPAYNRAHHDHFHFDRGLWRACR